MRMSAAQKRHTFPCQPVEGSCVTQTPTATQGAATHGEVLAGLRDSVSSVLFGKDDVVELALVTLLADGHLLIEDVPGVGKTLLARALGASIDARVRRIQFTPDLLPSDVVGVSVWSPDDGTFSFRPGPVFANIVLADEINRAGPKTQSALLEAMEEQTVTVDGHTRELASPFMVMATQNPIELDGTYPLPEAQRDRFLVRTALGYPDRSAEREVLHEHASGDAIAGLRPVTTAARIAEIIREIATITLADAIADYILDLVAATRSHDHLLLGASPRGGLALVRAARARAALRGRGHVLPDDVKALAVPVLAHRIQVQPRAHAMETTAADVVADIVATTRVPVS